MIYDESMIILSASADDETFGANISLYGDIFVINVWRAHGRLLWGRRLK